MDPVKLYERFTMVGKMDPVKLCERVEQKTKKKVELISLLLKKDKDGGGGGDGDKKTEEKPTKQSHLSILISIVAGGERTILRSEATFTHIEMAVEASLLQRWMEVAPALFIFPQKSSNCPTLETIAEEEVLDDTDEDAELWVFPFPS
ncbi:hypothetical protein NE237_000363 [Protea cynaroides]|uniref:Uncharacterized protein n=1 Tax=Protea cynaroides TaxID=273540 RepID=A0A9Q0KRB3_9MAGN|nr:hypothetical protein NE237_000363 [Protea cynaroides]